MKCAAMEYGENKGKPTSGALLFQPLLELFDVALLCKSTEDDVLILYNRRILLAIHIVI